MWPTLTLVEFVRVKDDSFLGPFTIAQLISVVLLMIGATLMLRRAEVEVAA